jgi:hypothetical protein
MIRGHGRNSLAAAAISCRAERGRKPPSAEMITIMAGRKNFAKNRLAMSRTE